MRGYMLLGPYMGLAKPNPTLGFSTRWLAASSPATCTTRSERQPKPCRLLALSEAGSPTTAGEVFETQLLLTRVKVQKHEERCQSPPRARNSQARLDKVLQSGQPVSPTHGFFGHLYHERWRYHLCFPTIYSNAVGHVGIMRGVAFGT